jgi:hypothetical protein
MVSWIRRRVTIANVAIVAALVLAMSGGAYAAKRYLITSTKQISPKVLKKLRGARGPAGSPGLAGPQGPRGPQGPEGAKGANGTNGTNGKDGESVTVKEVPKKVAACAEQGGSEFKSGATTTFACNGQTGFTKTLPSGETEKGTWGLAGTASAAKQLETGSIAFVIPLATAPASAHLIRAPTEAEEENEEFPAPPTGCTGNVAAPGAEKGNLCVFARRYENAESYASTFNFLNPEGLGLSFFNQAGRSGTTVVAQSAAAGTVFAIGTWAVTAS